MDADGAGKGFEKDAAERLVTRISKTNMVGEFACPVKVE